MSSRVRRVALVVLVLALVLVAGGLLIEREPDGNVDGPSDRAAETPRRSASRRSRAATEPESTPSTERPEPTIEETGGRDFEIRIEDQSGSRLLDATVLIAAARSGPLRAPGEGDPRRRTSLVWRPVETTEGVARFHAGPGESAIRVSCPGYESTFAVVGAAGDRVVVVTLRKLVPVRGSVRDASGELVPNASVELRRVPVAPEFEGEIARGELLATTTAVDGWYEFPDVAPGMLVEVRATVPQGIGVGTQVAAETAGELTAVLRRPGGTEFELATSLRALGSRIETVRVDSPEFEGRMSTEGHVARVDGLPEGRYWFRIELSNQDWIFRRLAISRGERSRVVLSAEDLGELAGRVQIADERLRRHRTYLRIKPHGSVVDGLRHPQSGALLGPLQDAVFRVAGIEPGRYDVSVGVRSSEVAARNVQWSQPIRVTAPDPSVVIPDASVWSAVDPARSVDAELRAWSIDSVGNVDWSRPRVCFSSDSDEAPTMAEVSVDDVWLCSVARGSLRSTRRIPRGTNGSVTLELASESAPVEPLRFQVSAGGSRTVTSRVRVLEALQSMGIDAAVNWSIAGKETEWTPGPDGVVVVEDPPSCAFHALVDAPGFGSVVVPVPTSDTRPGEFRVALPRLAHVRLTLRSRTGRPCSGWRVTLRPSPDEPTWLRFETTTDKTGTTDAMVPRGTAIVEVEPNPLFETHVTRVIELDGRGSTEHVIELPFD